MKLHLPRALRGALLAALALTCTAPAWAGEWSGNTYVIDAADIAKDTFLLTTANGTADRNGWFLRTTTADDASGVAEGAATATITSLILNKPGTEAEGAVYTLNIAGHWENEAGMFSNLRIGKIMAGSEFTKEAPATVKIATSNVVSLGDLELGSDEVRDMSDSIKLEVNGTLNINFNDFAGTSTTDDEGNITYSGGLADNISGSGTVNLWGEIVWESEGEGVLWAPDMYDSSFSFSASGMLNVDHLRVNAAGNIGYLSYDASTDRIIVFVVTAPTGRYTDSSTPDNPPTVSYTSGSFTSTNLGALEGGSANASKSWTLSIEGTIYNNGINQDVILLSSHEIASPDALADDYDPGQFCLLINEDGDVFLRNKDNAEDAEATRTYTSLHVATIEGYDSNNWESITFSTTLNYYLWSTYYMLSVGDVDVEGLTCTSSGSTGSIVISGSPASSTLDNLYARLPENSQLEVAVTGGDALGGSYWLLTEDINVTQLTDGSLMDYSTNSAAIMTSTDALRFSGGTLTASSGGTVTLSNTIETEGNQIPKLAATPGTTLVLTKGESALNSNEGLEISGGGTVLLQGVKTTAPQHISVAENTTLSISGPSTLTVDASMNSFEATASLDKANGGTLVYIAKSSDKIGTLSNARGTVEVQNQLTAENINAKKLSLLADGTDLTITGTAQLQSLQMNAWGSSTITQLEAENLVISDRADLYGAGLITAKNVITKSMYVDGDSVINIGDGMLAITGSSGWDGADVSGVLQSNTIGITALSSSTPANMKGVVLTGDSLSALSMTGAYIHVASPKPRAGSSSSASTVLELGTVTGSLITGVLDTTIQNSDFIGTEITFSAGQLSLVNTSHDGSSTITHTQADSAISLSNVSMAQGSTITVGNSGSTFTMATDANAPEAISLTGSVTTNQMTLTGLVIDVSDASVSVGNIMLIDSDTGKVNLDGCTITLYTAPGYVGTAEVTAEGDVIYTTENKSDQIYEEVATTANGRAARSALMQAATAAGGELADLYADILDSSHISSSERQRTLEALTSGSLTMLADSQRRGVVNHTNTLRNRIIQMGHSQGIETETAWHAWIEADGSYNDISGDDAAGYEFNTWGGTVGMHADVGNFTFGAAISAAYGELTADSVDNAEGNNDTITASAFVRHQNRNWVQMGILSVGLNELDMERTVGDYSAKADTEGMTVTAYYELGYTYALGDSGSQVIQPLVSLMLTSAQMDGFSESGSIGNAGLTTEDEDYFYGTLGIGARYQAIIAEDINERISFIEVRAKLVQDFGDDTHEASVRFAGAPGHSFMLQGTEVGSFGFQFGAGISVPLGLQTTFFADVDADIRDNATSVSGSMGVRVAF